MDPDDNNTLSTADIAALDEMRAADPPEDDAAPPPAELDPSVKTPEEEAAEAGEQQQRQKMVPHAAMHEERIKRQEAERQLVEERRRTQIVEERTNILLQAGLGQPQPEPSTVIEPPPVGDDPVGHFMGTLRNMGLTLEGLVAAEKQRQEQGQAVQGVQRVQQRAIALENAFKTETPDYMDAVTFLRQSRNGELEDNGYTDPAEREWIIAQEAIGVAARAMSNNANPAAVLYNMAKRRGYKAAAANGETADPGAKLRSVAAGQETAKSLGNTRGGASAPLTLDRLANMSDADFKKYYDTPAGRAARGA